MSSRRLQDMSSRHFQDMSSRCLQDMSLRRLQDQQMFTGEKLEMTSNYSFLENVSLNPSSVNDSHQRCSVKKGVLPKAYKFIKKEPLAQVFSSEFCEISKKTYLIEHLLMSASRGTAVSEAY